MDRQRRREEREHGKEPGKRRGDGDKRERAFENIGNLLILL